MLMRPCEHSWNTIGYGLLNITLGILFGWMLKAEEHKKEPKAKPLVTIGTNTEMSFPRETASVPMIENGSPLLEKFEWNHTPRWYDRFL